MDYYINWGLCNLPTFKLPAVIATNGPKIRTRHSKLAQKLASRRNVKFPRQLSPKLAQFGGKTA